MTDTETTVKKQIPTVAKVQEMIDDVLDSNYDFHYEMPYDFYRYTIAANNTESNGYYEFGSTIHVYKSYSTIIDEYKIQLNIYQTTTDKKTLTLCYHDSGNVLYNLDNLLKGDFTKVSYSTADIYLLSTTIDLSGVSFDSKNVYPSIELYYGDDLVRPIYVNRTIPKISIDLVKNIEYNYKYAIDSLTPSQFGYLFGKYAYSTKSNYDETKASYQITDDHTIYLKFLQDNTNQPVVRIRTGDTVLYIIDYQLSSELKEVNYYFPDSSVGSKAYQGEAYIDLSSIIVYTNDESEIKLSVIQNGEFQDVVALPKKKLVASISKPDDNTILTFGNFRDLIYPPGSIFISTNNINPETFMGGTWETITGIISSGYSWVRLLS